MQNLVDSLSQRFNRPVPMSQHASLLAALAIYMCRMKPWLSDKPLGI